MEFKDIKNDSERVLKDISSEFMRKYIYVVDGEVIEMSVKEPIALHISSSGHYIVDSTGKVHFFTNGFIAMMWNPKFNESVFVI